MTQTGSTAGVDLSFVEQAALAGGAKFLQENPELLNKLIALGMQWAAALLTAWLTEQIAKAAAQHSVLMAPVAGPRPVD